MILEKKQLINEITAEIGTLLKARLNAYILKHWNGEEHRFANCFILHEVVDLHLDPLRDVQRCYEQINSFLSKDEGVRIRFVGMFLDVDMTLTYLFHWEYKDDEEYFGFEEPVLIISLKGGNATLDSFSQLTSVLEILESEDTEFLSQLLTNIRAAISFGTLKL